MTMNKIFQKLRNKNRHQYRLLGFCIFLSVFLISSFSFMYFGATIQNFLPKGGDTRKMADLLLAVTGVGCTIFTLYASTLFFRYKSREYGIFLALGAPKKTLKRILFFELSILTAAASCFGIILGLPASFLIWRLFETFLILTESTPYQFGAGGFLAGLVFALILSLLLGFMGRLFVGRSDIMDILRANQKTEMVKEIKAWTLPVGIVLIILGVLLGLGLNTMSVRLFSRSIPGTELFYLLALLGIYLVLLSVVSQNRLRKNKTKFYKNMVSVSLMRFSAKSTTRNMCVIVLLLFCCMFSAFYGLLYNSTAGMTDPENSREFAMHYPASETQISKTDIERTADEYFMTLKDFTEEDASNLVISYKTTDYNNGKYFDINKKESRLALFLPARAYETLTGRKTRVRSGTYKTVTSTDYKENIWDYMDGLYAITNPDTNKTLPLTFDGSLEYDSLYSMSSPYAYVINDKDYGTITKNLSEQYREHIVFFNVADFSDSYAFAKDLLDQYIGHSTTVSDHVHNYDLWEAKLADEAGEKYDYSETVDFTGNTMAVLDDWKYAPQFSIIMKQDYMQLICIYVMLCLYIFIITLSAVAIMNYVRSISIAENNKALFENLNKLGADAAYRRSILKKQLARIFQYPGVLGCTLGLVFSITLSWINDSRLTALEIRTLQVMTGICAFILAFLYIVYRVAKKNAEKIVGI